MKNKIKIPKQRFCNWALKQEDISEMVLSELKDELIYGDGKFSIDANVLLSYFQEVPRFLADGDYSNNYVSTTKVELI